MPPSWVRNEKKWKKSKEIVKKQYDKTKKDGEDFWKLVVGVYKQMRGEMGSAEEGIIIEDYTPDRLPRHLWHGTKYMDFIAKDNLVMKTTMDRGFIEGIRFTSDPAKLKNYEIFPFWIRISSGRLKPVDFLRVEGLWAHEDEYLYIGKETFDLKPHIEEIYVHKKSEEYFKNERWAGKYYKHVEAIVKRYNIPLVFGEKRLWEDVNIKVEVQKNMGSEVIFKTKEAINEVNIVFDPVKAKSKISSGGYSSFEDMMKAEYGFYADDPVQYKVKKDGVIDVPTFVFKLSGKTEKSRVRINKFMADFHGQFKSDKDLERLNPDFDGFSYTPTVLAGGATAKDTTGSKPTLNPPETVKADKEDATPKAGEESKEVIIKKKGAKGKKVPESLSFWFGNSELVASFANSKKEGRVDLKITGGSKDILGEMDREYVLSANKNSLWDEIFSDYLYINFSSLLNGLDDPVVFRVRTYTFEAYIVESIFKKKGDIKYKVEVMDTRLRNSVKRKNQSFEVSIGSQISNYESLYNKLKEETEKVLEADGVFGSGKGAVLGEVSKGKVKSVAQRVTRIEKEILKALATQQPQIFDKTKAKEIFRNFSFRFNLMLDSNSALAGIKVTISATGFSDVTRSNMAVAVGSIEDVVISELKKKGIGYEYDKSGSGIGRDGIPFVYLVITDDKLLDHVYTSLKLQERFKISGVSSDVEAVRGMVGMDLVLDYYKGLPIVDVDYSIKDSVFESVIVFDESVCDEDMCQILDRNRSMVALFDKNINTFIAFDTVEGIEAVGDLLR